MKKNSINQNNGINATMMIYFLSLEHPLQWSQQFLSPPIYLARAPPPTTSYTLPVGINYMSSGSPFENLTYIFSREFAIVRRSGCLTWHGACARNRAINTLQRRNEQQGTHQRIGATTSARAEFLHTGRRADTQCHCRGRDGASPRITALAPEP